MPPSDSSNEQDATGNESLPVLKNRSFRQLWLANFSGDMGNQVTSFALSITAVVFLHASAFEVALIAALARSANLILGIPAGVWIDRWPRKWVLVSAALLQTLVVASVPVAYASDSLTVVQLIIIAPLLSISELFFDVAHTAVLPPLVGRDRVSEANARLSVSDNTARIVGPGAAGALLKIVSAPLLYVVSTAASLLTAVMASTINVSEKPTITRDREKFWPSMTAGLRYVGKSVVLRTFMINAGTVNLGAGLIGAIYPLFILRDLGLTASQMGLALSIGAVGGIAGSIAGLPIMKLLGEIRTILVAICCLPIIFVLAPLTPFVPLPDFALVSTVEFLLSFAIVTYGISSSGIVARVTPNAMLGRVTSARRFVTLGSIPLGSLLGGATATWLGNDIALFLSVACIVGGAGNMLVSPLRSHRTLPTGWEAPAL
ncbi:MFS transporter [Spelaeicoccus albus]|uniref:MFS family permease n=1 Tax=Spelaeicoccus albus TaxID=1280376 RepID=A0A7Z0D301_9MICO|nr:MFS transporter [Spelaeicoccus albus]NYI67922.1 MFS family permease [Spelaeicoccus albus]